MKQPVKTSLQAKERSDKITVCQIDILPVPLRKYSPNFPNSTFSFYNQSNRANQEYTLIYNNINRYRLFWHAN